MSVYIGICQTCIHAVQIGYKLSDAERIRGIYRILRIKNGDIISIDIPNYLINLEVSEEELEKRRKEMPLKIKKDITGYLKRYSSHVSSADHGAVIEG